MTDMSTCNKCGARYPSAPVGAIHKCLCDGGILLRDDQHGKIHTDGSRSGGQPVVAQHKALAVANKLLGIDRATLGELSHNELMTAMVLIVQQSEAFKQEVSDALLRYHAPLHVPHGLRSFIITKPDPLEEVLLEIDHAAMWVDKCAEEIRASLKARGFEIREKNDD